MPPEIAALDIGAEVREALAARRPLVALESTIISHGMPYPRNAQTAMRVQACVRAEGAAPATIAILRGRVKLGLTDHEIDYLGREGQRVAKVSRRDLPLVVAGGGDGATTVAATMIIAAKAGIPVFATGGIGGVHRGVEQTMDVSADLEELGKTNVTVVCAGVKSVLDIPRTLEYLETRGVPVLGFGTDTMPAFYSQSSGLALDYRIDSPRQAARAMLAKRDLGLGGGMVIAVPVPDEHALAPGEIDRVIEDAIESVALKGITGKAITPVLLDRIAEETGGRSLDANIELVVNNARVAARIALEYARLASAATLS